MVDPETGQVVPQRGGAQVAIRIATAGVTVSTLASVAGNAYQAWSLTRDMVDVGTDVYNQFGDGYIDGFDIAEEQPHQLIERDDKRRKVIEYQEPMDQVAEEAQDDPAREFERRIPMVEDFYHGQRRTFTVRGFGLYGPHLD